MYRRINSHYVVKRKNNQLSIHHCPFWFFYVATSASFFVKRSEAYQRIARRIKEGKGRFWQGIEVVTADSFSIDYSRETGKPNKRKASTGKRIGDTLLCLTNLRNWFFPRTIVRAWRSEYLHILFLSAQDFIGIYERR